MKLRYKQVYSGEPYTLTMRRGLARDRIACCDCGLVHDFVFRVDGRHLAITVYRNNRATAGRRRGMHGRPGR